MRAVFNLNHEKLAADPRFAATARELSAQSRIESRVPRGREIIAYCSVGARSVFAAKTLE